MSGTIRRESQSDVAAIDTLIIEAFLHVPHTSRTEQFIVKALTELWKLDAAGCVVLGEPQYYDRFGFKADPALVLPDVPPEYFQAMAF